jgi:hypothetical protein
VTTSTRARFAYPVACFIAANSIGAKAARAFARRAACNAIVLFAISEAIAHVPGEAGIRIRTHFWHEAAGARIRATHAYTWTRCFTAEFIDAVVIQTLCIRQTLLTGPVFALAQ